MAFAHVLREDDQRLLEQCTHIALTEDTRAGYEVVRARLTMGRGLPAGMSPPAAPGAEARPRGVQAAPHSGGHVHGSVTLINGCHGKHIFTVERLLTLRKQAAYETTVDKAAGIVDALRDLAGDAWEQVRHKVMVFCPDGGADEQLAGRLVSSSFPNLFTVARCMAHGVHGAVKDGWKCDPEVQSITQTIVQEVAKFLKTSDRFRQRFQSRQQGDIMQSVTSFSFAPQRFASLECPLGRFVLHAESVMLVLADEVEWPSKPTRRQWAVDILERLRPPVWVLIGMLADLADDCVAFLRHWDQAAPDAITASTIVEGFQVYLRREYMEGAMWQRRNTYSEQVPHLLRTTRVLPCHLTQVLLKLPTQAEIAAVEARLRNVAKGISDALRAEYPNFGHQRLFSCLQLSQPTGTRFAGCFPQVPGSRAERRARLSILLRTMAWSREEEKLCLQQYTDMYAEAIANKQKQADETDRNIWAELMKLQGGSAPRGGSAPLMQRVVLTALGFLLTETECERNLGAEKRSSVGRARLHPTTRRDALK